RVPAALHSAHGGDDTIGAALVASAHDGDVAGYGRVQPGHDSVIVLERALLGQYPGLGLFFPEEKRLQFAVIVRTDHVIDMVEFHGDFLPVILGHAADDGYAHRGIHPLVMPHGGDAGVGSVLGPSADGTGVHDEDVGFGGLAGHEHAFFFQHAADKVGIVNVHLASEGRQEIFA